jgi:hypothetical protein
MQIDLTCSEKQYLKHVLDMARKSAARTLRTGPSMTILPS